MSEFERKVVVETTETIELKLDEKDLFLYLLSHKVLKDFDLNKAQIEYRMHDIYDHCHSYISEENPIYVKVTLHDRQEKVIK